MRRFRPAGQIGAHVVGVRCLGLARYARKGAAVGGVDSSGIRRGAAEALRAVFLGIREERNRGVWADAEIPLGGGPFGCALRPRPRWSRSKGRSLARERAESGGVASAGDEIARRNEGAATVHFGTGASGAEGEAGVVLARGVPISAVRQ